MTDLAKFIDNIAATFDLTRDEAEAYVTTEKFQSSDGKLITGALFVTSETLDADGNVISRSYMWNPEYLAHLGIYKKKSAVQ